MSAAVYEQVKKIISTQLGIPEEQIELESHFNDDLNADPLSIADLVVSLEDEFKIRISEEAMLKFNTISDVVNYLTDKIGEEI
ncbi:MAG: acyl carrier protein [Candidatus Woykebacteria bacterium RBG_13_40_7b]|uniref:Acyl carrier protein n=1 Tax=Candidatus Woykebacteria bacterium RBG_13_40_7b TaxID=1802594 RepID=A0A1G1W7M7_9BACT|nr:MAG: acyl carrier protein [Candidatus Woykebacteria bacterium RBG_13_40_7b]